MKVSSDKDAHSEDVQVNIAASNDDPISEKVQIIWETIESAVNFLIWKAIVLLPRTCKHGHPWKLKFTNLKQGQPVDSGHKLKAWCACHYPCERIAFGLEP